MKHITLIIGLLVVGCGEVENGAYKHRPKQSTNTKPVKELTIKDVVGSYEGYKKGRTVFLDNGVVENYMLMDTERRALVSIIKLTEK